MPETTKNEKVRLENRVAPNMYAKFKRAAEISGRTVNSFMLEAADKAAEETIEKCEIVKLSIDDQECFVQALLSPPKIAPALERAFQRHSSLLREKD